MQGQDKPKVMPKEPRPEWAVLLDKKALMSPEEAADVLSFSAKTVLELVRDGKLRAHCHNGVKQKPTRITTKSIKKFLFTYSVDPDEWKE